MKNVSNEPNSGERDGDSIDLELEDDDTIIDDRADFDDQLDDDDPNPGDRRRDPLRRPL